MLWVVRGALVVAVDAAEQALVLSPRSTRACTQPDVEPGAQTIACPYEFRSGDVVFSQTVGHHYLLPEQLVYLLDESGFAIDSLGGGFDGDTFDPAESEHVVIVAHRKADC